MTFAEIFRVQSEQRPAAAGHGFSATPSGPSVAVAHLSGHGEGWKRALALGKRILQWRRGQPRRLRLCESLPLGERRFVAVVEFEQSRFLVGGTASSLVLLARLEEGEKNGPGKLGSASMGSGNLGSGNLESARQESANRRLADDGSEPGINLDFIRRIAALEGSG
jgi:hypothetical protein